MGFKSVRGIVHLASGLGGVTQARAKEAAHDLMSLPGVGIATGSKVAVQAGTLAEELLSVATTNRPNVVALVRSEVDAAVSRLGLVSADKLEESQAEAARLRAVVAELRSTVPKASTQKGTAKQAAPRKTTAKRTSATSASAKPAPLHKSPRTALKATGTRRSAISHRTSDGT